MPTDEELRVYISQKFCEHLGLRTEDVFDQDLSLAGIIDKAPSMTNSVDLMEAFAKTSNVLRREYGLRVRLPALALDTPISKVLEAFLAEARQARGAA